MINIIRTWVNSSPQILQRLFLVVVPCSMLLECFILRSGFFTFLCSIRLLFVGQVSSFKCLCIFLMCLFRTSLVKNSFPHWLHCSSLMLSCTRLIWLRRCFLLVYSFPQFSHLWSLWPSWTFLICFGKSYDLEIIALQSGHSVFTAFVLVPK